MLSCNFVNGRTRVLGLLCSQWAETQLCLTQGFQLLARQELLRLLLQAPAASCWALLAARSSACFGKWAILPFASDKLSLGDFYPAQAEVQPRGLLLAACQASCAADVEGGRCLTARGQVSAALSWCVLRCVAFENKVVCRDMPCRCRNCKGMWRVEGKEDSLRLVTRSCAFVFDTSLESSPSLSSTCRSPHNQHWPQPASM